MARKISGEFLEGEFFFDLVILACVYLYLFSWFTPQLLLSKTTTTGGDTGSHYYLAYYMREHLLPNLRLSWWSPDWLGGLPLFHFYFIPPYLFMAILSYVIGLQVAFKIGSVFGIFLLPVASYVSLKSMDFKFPIPVVSSVFSLCILFNSAYMNYGGTVTATLTGAIANSWAFSFLVLFTGLIYRDVKAKAVSLTTSLSLSLVVMSHIIIGVLNVLPVGFLFVKNLRDWKKTRALTLTVFIAFTLTAFWSLPLVYKFGYSSPPVVQYVDYEHYMLLMPKEMRFFYIIFALGVASMAGQYIRQRKVAENEAYILFLTFSSMALAFTWGMLYSINYERFITFSFYMITAFSAVTVCKLAGGAGTDRVTAVLCLFLVVMWISYGFVEEARSVTNSLYQLTGVEEVRKAGHMLADTGYISRGYDKRGWISHNYGGLEKFKDSWRTFRELTSYIRGLNGSGRVIAEYYDYGFIGSPRVFEISPIFTKKPIMEGLLLESSPTFPYYFYIQKLFVADSWWSGAPMQQPELDAEKGMERLRLYNVHYFIAFTQKVKDAIEDTPGARRLRSFGSFSVYEINQGSGYVEPLRYKPVLVVTDDYNPFSYKWFDFDSLDTLLVYSQSLTDYEGRHFDYVIMNKTEGTQPEGKVLWDLSYKSLPRQRYDGDCKVSEKVGVDEIVFSTTCPGRPHLVKIPYFPNWKVEGAKKVYLASPALMVVIPDGEEVRLYYGHTAVDVFGAVVTASGVVFFCILLILKSGRVSRKSHMRFLKKTGLLRLNRRCKKCHKLCLKRGGMLASKLWKNKPAVFLALAVAAVSYGAVSEGVGYGRCASSCTERGFGSFEYLLGDGLADFVDLGTDSSGTDFLYVHDTSVNFFLKSGHAGDAVLRLRVGDWGRRCGRVYVNGRFLAEVNSSGTEQGWVDADVKVPAAYLNGYNESIVISHNDSKCYGWDLDSAGLYFPKCSCS